MENKMTRVYLKGNAEYEKQLEIQKKQEEEDNKIKIKFREQNLQNLKSTINNTLEMYNINTKGLNYGKLK